MHLLLTNGTTTCASGYDYCLSSDATPGGSKLGGTGYNVKLSLLVVLAGIGLLY